jgi:hypothetical protein
MHGDRLSDPGEPTYDTANSIAPRAQTSTFEMIKTFSISALCFMTIGMLLASHLSLPL